MNSVSQNQIPDKYHDQSHDSESTVLPEKLPEDDSPEFLAKKRSKGPHSDSEKSRGSPVSRKRNKIAQIKKALSCDPIQVDVLRQLAISRDGLVNDGLRKKAWPKLLDVNVDEILSKPETEVLQAHRDYNQVVLDVNRSLKRFPPGMEETHRMALQDQLVDVIMRVLVNHPELHYYQGYHDICVTFLLVVGEDIAFALVDKLSLNNLRDFMDANMDRTKNVMNYLYPILGKANPELREFMERAEVGTIFSLSWLITWYGHVLNDLGQIIRFYDFFIACHPLMPIYLAAAIVLYREKEVLACECEMCYVHSLLSKIPDHLPFEQLLSTAGDLFLQYPPTELANEAVVSFRRKSNALANYRSQRQANQRKRRNREKEWSLINQDGRNVWFKVTVWTVTAVLSAAAFTALSRISEWGWL